MLLAKSAPSRLQLGLEAALLFLGVPVLMLIYFGQYSLFGLVWILAGIALVLLLLTPGFRLKWILGGFSRRGWLILGIFTALTAAAVYATVQALVPERFLELPTHRPQLWMAIVILYPIFSAWPQELIYRSLFFERYGTLFPNRWVAIAANGTAFALGHLFFLNPVTIAMSGLAGAIIGWAYLEERSLWLAWAMHALAGILVFTAGLGIFFYHGAVGRAF